MDTQYKNSIRLMITNNILDIQNRCDEVKKSINDSYVDTMDFLHSLIAQIPQSGPLITKTPKALRKRGIQRIETIPENETLHNNHNNVSHSRDTMIKEEQRDDIIGRTKRKASIKAQDNIKKQQSLLLHTKLRRGSNEEVHVQRASKKLRSTCSKRAISSRSSSDEDDNGRPSKHSKIDDANPHLDVTKNLTKQHVKVEYITPVGTVRQETDFNVIPVPRRSSRKRSASNTPQRESKKANVMNYEVSPGTVHDVEELSMYEDAISKPAPVMNSTMKHNSYKIMNATVVLEQLNKPSKLNETVTIKPTSADSNHIENTKQHMEQNTMPLCASSFIKPGGTLKKTLTDGIDQVKNIIMNGELDTLITDDESSPEICRPKLNAGNSNKTANNNRAKRITRSMLSSDDEVNGTPAKQTTKGRNISIQQVKNAYKSSTLFSPYAKESVKKRVEAFEQVAMSPKSVDVDVPGRLTRTKTRAMAAAESENSNDTNQVQKTIAQKLARKSLARAKKISLAKQIESNKSKENKGKTHKNNKITNEKVNTNQKQQHRTTPVMKAKTQLPMSISRIQQTPNISSILLNPKPLTASRTNIVTSVESFISSSKTPSNATSADRIEEKKRKANEEDAKQKKDEALRLQTEEKRRKREEKELRNKLAREAKEKQDMEKRHRVEKDREEKAKLAQQHHEKHREEMEKRRLAQLQRTQEKEERRRQEEQQRLLRLQELEEAERLLAEQKRREQEAEKRREIEARAQQLMAAEAMKIKNQVIAQAKQNHTSNKHNNGPTNYILESEPDDDESDNESRPKHLIPHWAQMNVRREQLAMQRHISEQAVFKFFDTRKCTPDLTELFHGIDRSRLKRTSSAIWKTPPRYSMMES